MMLSPIASAFDQARQASSAAFIPFLTAGWPEPKTFLEILAALEDNGADLIEVGLPFSDPLADGPAIQAASRQALDQGVTPAKVLELVGQAKQRLACPLVLMTYYNPVLKAGLARFADLASQAGLAGVIIPDLPPEEADDWLAEADRAGLETIFMAAPTTPPARLKTILARGRGFLYFVSLTGVTGADLAISGELTAQLRLVKASSPLPVAVGFGVAGSNQARALAKEADGVIVGSALIRTIAGQKEKESQVKAAALLAASLKEALKIRPPKLNQTKKTCREAL